MRARSQQYAEITYALVAEIFALDGPEQKRYGALCFRFPLIVRECGLAAAFGFLAAKGGTDPDSTENRLLRHYATALNVASSEELRTAAVSAEFAKYRRLTRHTLMISEWFKRHAEGVLKVDATGAGEEEQVESEAVNA